MREHHTLAKDNRKIRILRALLHHEIAREQRESSNWGASMRRERRVLVQDRTRVRKLARRLRKFKRSVAKKIRAAFRRRAMISRELHNARVARKKLLTRLMALRHN